MFSEQISKSLLQSYIAQGLSSYKMAEIFNCSASTIRYWLKKYDLPTNRYITRQNCSVIQHDDQGNVLKSVDFYCQRHGLRGHFWSPSTQRYRCKQCSTEHVGRRRRLNIDTIKEEAGNICYSCGYDNVPSILHFHHKIAFEKEFEISRKGTIPIAKLRTEAAKCILLCPNCHAEVHNGFKAIDGVYYIATPKIRAIVEPSINCQRHGTSSAYTNENNKLYCKQCRSDAVSKRRRKVKEILVEEFGGQCTECGYSKCNAALQFHHIDPATKKFDIGSTGNTWGIETMRAEAKKCQLLCGNCHGEHHHAEYNKS